MLTSPRYFAGRQILVKHAVKSNRVDLPNYMDMDFGNKQNERFVTHKGVILGVDTESEQVIVTDIEGEQEAVVPLKEVLELN